MHIWGIRVDGLSPVTPWSSMTRPLSAGVLTVERGDDGGETVDICADLFLVGGVADGPERM